MAGLAGWLVGWVTGWMGKVIGFDILVWARAGPRSSSPFGKPTIASVVPQFGT